MKNLKDSLNESMITESSNEVCVAYSYEDQCAIAIFDEVDVDVMDQTGYSYEIVTPKSNELVCLRMTEEDGVYASTCPNLIKLKDECWKTFQRDSEHPEFDFLGIDWDMTDVADKIKNKDALWKYISEEIIGESSVGEMENGFVLFDPHKKEVLLKGHIDVATFESWDEASKKLYTYES